MVAGFLMHLSACLSGTPAGHVQRPDWREAETAAQGRHSAAMGDMGPTTEKLARGSGGLQTGGSEQGTPFDPANVGRPTR